MDMEAEQQMELTLPIWSSDDFVKKLKEFNEGEKSEQSALDILKELIEIQDDQVNKDAWIECSLLLELLLKSIEPSTLFVTEKMLCIQALVAKSPNVVKVLAQILADRPGVTELLSNQAVEVAIHFARHLNHADTYESIATLLAPVSKNANLLLELKNLHDSANSVQLRFKIYQVVIEALRQEVYHDGLDYFMDAIKELLDGDDYIGKLCALEMLTEAAGYNQKSCDILSKLSVTTKVYGDCAVKQAESDLFHASMVYLSALCRMKPEHLQKFEKLPAIIVETITTSDAVPDLTFMVDSLQQIVVTAEGKQNIQEAIGVEDVSRLLKAMFSRKNFKSVAILRDRVIAFFGSIFEDDKDVLCAEWFAFISQDLCTLLTTSLAKGAEKEREHAIGTLAVLLRKRWAVEEFMKMEKKKLDTFIEWVTEYTDPIYDHTAMKRLVLSRFVKSNDYAELVDPAIKKRIEDSLQTRTSFDPQLETVNN